MRVRSLLWLLALLSGAAQAVPVTLAWDLNPSHNAAGTVWEWDVSGQSRTCVPTVTATDRRCVLDLARGPTTLRLRVVQGALTSGWSNTLSLNVVEPGVFTIAWHQEAAPPPPVPTIISYVVIQDSDGTMSRAVTVPAGTAMVLVYVNSWNNPGRTVTSMTLSGSAFIQVRQDLTLDGDQSHLYVGLAPVSGTFSASFSGAFSEGGIAMLVFLDGASSIVSSAVANLPNSATLNFSLASAPGDLALLFAGTWQSAVNVSQAGQTPLVSGGPFNTNYYGVATKRATGSSTSLSASGSWPGAAAVVVRGN